MCYSRRFDRTIPPSQDGTSQASTYGPHTGSVKGLNDGHLVTSLKARVATVEHARPLTLPATVSQPDFCRNGNVFLQVGRLSRELHTYTMQTTHVSVAPSDRLTAILDGRLRCHSYSVGGRQSGFA
ncbi:hypothetical protein PGTUg99_008436 [Puccinia graminis f. sp. tritici]|uniref:Uncharacterized protein n=1 Tax=Puccinia graminis f. sp. tritici TaxID=56615 RepID=A0A5B0RPK7_PUCGR|nr:hypothetical protein PGTUg99_008436 [Puccinia graminis f. sp. tritici]